MAGAGYSDIPLILAAKRLGFYVITGGNRASDLGHTESDEISLVDYSDKEALLSVAKQFGVVGVYPSCNDFSAISCAYVAEKLELPGHDPYEISRTIHLKDKFRQWSLDNGLPAPFAESFSSAKEANRAIRKREMPVMIKPTDLTGGKGISKVHDYRECDRALAKAFKVTRSGKIVIEAFLSGSKHGMSAFVIRSEVAFFCVDNEQYYLNDYLVSGASMPATISNEAILDLNEQIKTILNLLVLKDGIFQLQFILTTKKPIIIEICRRSPGDLYLLLAQHYTGINYADFIVRSVTGLDFPNIKKINKNRFLSRHCIMASRNGLLKNIIINKELDLKIIEKFIYIKNGDRINNYLIDKLGILIIEFQNKEDLDFFNLNFEKLIIINLE